MWKISQIFSSSIFCCSFLLHFVLLHRKNRASNVYFNLDFQIMWTLVSYFSSPKLKIWFRFLCIYLYVRESSTDDSKKNLSHWVQMKTVELFFSLILLTWEFSVARGKFRNINYFVQIEVKWCSHGKRDISRIKNF